MLALALPAGAPAASPATVQTSWRLLDYIGVDYAGAVQDGRIINSAEYAEMVEFAGQVQANFATLPPSPARTSLSRNAGLLKQAVARKAAPAEVARLARSVADALVAAYPVPLAPSSPPDLARGAVLYAENCAACHGANGDGRGPSAAGLDPPPIAFTDLVRARQRSLFGLYQTIGQGVEGTAMPSFAAMPNEDRWALAFHAGAFAYPETDEAKGARLWREDAALRGKFPNLAALTRATPEELATEIGPDRARLITAFLRRNPQAVALAPTGSLAFARERLEASLAAYRAGDQERAADLALSAYLDGFEPVEAVLATRDAALMSRIERAMGELRAAIGNRRPLPDVAAAVETLDRSFGEAESVLAPERASSASSFVGALTILLREGIEALLIIVAMIAFLRKTGRPNVLRYVHGGWTSALLAGGLTWVAATRLVAISGASRELTEGVGSLFAALVLLSVGIWMHGKSNAVAWQRYIQDKMTRALSRRSAWFLFLLAFVVVYREVFETILFYAALWAQGNGGAMLAGAGTGAAMLALLAWIMLRYSTRLPITRFFSWSSVLIAVLAVILAGKGVAGLQEAGLIPVNPVAVLPRVEVLGLFPTRETLFAQLAALVVLMMGFRSNRRNSPPNSDRTTSAELGQPAE